ncbi:aminopeptidase N [Propionivibrio sp.]|uniref:aminopeptidase N n=1 Tax=Propionivibrio sp. TaxID=2212460 RepID=UPI00272E7255|nr:aminopeptidase N [Propionivibrio sp.]
MSHDTPTPIRLEDYTPPPFLIDAVKLDVDVRETGTITTALLDVQRNPALAARVPLALDGEDLETLAVDIDGRTLAASEFSIEGNRLTIAEVPDRFVLKTTVRIQPDKNTQLSGFYRSRDGYFTQCEPEGFRRITWFIDRPDVMARYTVTLHADKATFPILLANGNPVASGDEGGEDEGRHFATWEDPFRKPSYLFAMVAGKLDVLRDTYRTASGRDVLLAIFVEPGKLDQCAHAMEALKKSMRWDEQRFGLECDLDHYMIVAVGDFNMGAMENKGLNIFNTKYVLARADLATDTDFENIDRVVAHEYFHNWTGNRVTCRDWFQLSLKEGLTVFRDQEFGADTHSRQVARIREVRGLRAMQFPEDAGPMAHPVRPSTYVEINNFYTATVYEKGAEVVRMIQTLIGREAFRKGMDIYFERHDGQAVTCDDFVAAMAAASGFDFTPFMAWYHQAGTPRVTARGTYDAGNRRYMLTLAQSCAPTPGQPEKTPYLIPVAVGLVGPDGENLDLTVQTPSFRRKPESRIAENELDPGLRRDDGESRQTVVLQLTEPEQTFVFENVPAAPVPSLLRNFSAPVVLDYPYSDADLAHLLAHDSDPFNRWEAGQRLFGRLILANAQRISEGATADCPASVIDAARKVLLGDSDPAFIAEALTLPGEATLAEQMEVVDPEALFLARSGLARTLAVALEADFRTLYTRLAPVGDYRAETAEAGRRRLRNLCLDYLNRTDTSGNRALAFGQFLTADNMTDQFAALAVLANNPGDEGGQALADFYRRWQHEALVVDKWLAVQAASCLPDTPQRVEELTRHPAFDLKNPNKVYSLLRTFGGNHRHFHAADGSGYRFLAGRIAALDPVNPQVAARLARCFDRWKKFDAGRQAQARAALESLHRQDGLSRDVFEVVDKALR